MLKHRFITTQQQRRRHYSQSSETSCEDLIIVSNLNKYSKSYSNYGQHQQSISSSTVYTNRDEDLDSSFNSSTFIRCFGSNKWSTPPVPVPSSSSSASQQKHQFENNFHINREDGNDGDHNLKTAAIAANFATVCSKGQLRFPKRRPKQCNTSSEVLMRRWNSFHSTRGECHPNRFRQNRKSVANNIEQVKYRKFSTPIAKFYQDVPDKDTKSFNYNKNEPTSSIIKKKADNNDNSDTCNIEKRTENISSRNERKLPTSAYTGIEFKRGKSLIEYSLSSLKNVQSSSSTSSLFCFGKRNGGSFRRPSECFVLETSEMIVIDYPESQIKSHESLQNQFSTNNENSRQLYTSSGSVSNVNKFLASTNFGEQFPDDKIIDSKFQSQSSANLQSDINSSNLLYNSDIIGGATASDVNSNEFLTQQQQYQKISGGGIALTTINTSATSTATNNHIVYCSFKTNTSGGSGGSTTSNSASNTSNGQVLLNFRSQMTSAFTGLVPTTSATTTIANMDHHHLRQTTGGFLGNRPELYQKCNRGSHSSDTSSAYSGSDTMTSVHSSSLDVDEVDLSGLVESVVDSDEEDLAESMDSLNVRDAVRDCLEKDPSERTEDDIETLLDFTQTLKAFTNMTLSVRRALCSVMVFAVVDKAGTMVMSDGEELDSWSVLINGHVEIEHSDGEKEELQVGDSFGILPTMDKLYHRGVMRTKCDDCQFVCITQTDYYRIQHQGVENIKRHEENGKLVMVTELRHIGGPDAGTTLRRGHIVIRGTPERLMLQLIEENSMTDPTFVEDFLLTHRTFISNPQEVAKTLLQWFENESVSPQQTTATSSEIRDRVTRVILLWVNNHFTDFETDTEMMELLEHFETNLEKKNMHGQLRLLHIACAAKARTRNVTLTRSSRDEDLHFTIIGGYERGNYGIFISKVNKKTKAEDVGLKRGDQILEVNGQSFEHVTYNRAIELIMSSTHLSITVKSNLLAFKEMLQAPDNNSPRSRQNRRRICVSDLAKMQATAISDSRSSQRLSTVELLAHDTVDCCQSPLRDFSVGTFIVSNSAKKEFPTVMTSSISSNSSSSSSSNKGFMTLGPKRRIQKALIKMNLLPKNFAADINVDDEQILSGSLNSVGISTNTSTTMTTTSRTGSSSSIGRTNNLNSNNNHQTIQSGGGGGTGGLYHSHSNPDLTNICYEDNRVTDYPEHVLKVYKSDQTCKYLLINKETTAHEVVMLALQEFGIHETSSNFSLCEVSVGEGGMIKQRRLPEQLQNLAERIGLCSRYYLKTNGITETLVPDEMAPELIRESTVHFLQLNANEVAIQLTLQDFSIFRQIESTEYVDDLFELKSKYGTPLLKQFAELVNREMFWVVTEVCSEHNMVRRMKIIKQFIKIARHCKECRNFNSMFAIISGLGHAAVSRLRQTWEKLPSKYQKLFTDLQDLMDPSRNMSKYRQLVSAELLAQHPIIPFYPVVKKDLTFIHLGNDTHIDSLINFEKLRMIAKEVRLLTHMCSSTYDLLTMLEYKGQAPSSAMLALNQMAVSAGSCTLHGQVTVKRRKKSAAAPNPKKMFEEAQMVRRVKAYLNNMKLITDEEVLHNLSLECEPGGSTGSNTGNTGGSGNGSGGGSTGGGSAPNSVTIRKRHPSPTLSTTSSTSSTSEGKKNNITSGPKFGAASPQAVKKLLSLSEQTKTRPYQPKHPGIPLPLVAHSYGLHHALHHTSISPSPSPGAHRRMGSGSSAGSGSVRAVHERSHSDTPTPLPSVDLSAESSSVTSLSNLPLRKTIISGSVTSSDSGHSSCVQDIHSNCSENTGLYHVASSIVHNTPSPTLQQRRHSSINAPSFYLCSVSTSSLLSASNTTPPTTTLISPHYQLHTPLSNSNFQPQHQLQHHQQQQQQQQHQQPKQQLQQFNSPPSSSLLTSPPSPSPSSLSNHSTYNKSNSLNLLSQNTTIMINSSDSSVLNSSMSSSGSSSNSSNINSTVNALLQVAGAVNGPCLAMTTNGGGVPSNSNNNICDITTNSILLPSLLSHSVNSYTHQQQQQKQQQQSIQYQAIRDSGLNSMPPPPTIKGPRHPPAYSVAAQMARLHRLGRAHSHEGVTSSSTNFYHTDPCDEDDDDDAQVSAV